MPAGKSSERLTEEIAVYRDGTQPLFSLNPIEVYKITGSWPLEPEFSGVCVPGLPSDGLDFHAFFISSRQHLQIVSDRPFLKSDGERDWQVADRSAEGNVVVLQCSLTGAQLTITIYDSELPQSVRQTFSASALASRASSSPPTSSNTHGDKHSSATTGHGHSSSGGPKSSGGSSGGTTGTGVSTLKSWNLFARIASDLSVTPPEERRNISADNPIPATQLDLHVVLPFLGFTFDPESRLFLPPRDGSPEFTHWLRRVLLEAKLETTSLHDREPALPAVARFLGCEAISGDSHLSPPAYGCLGCVSAFGDDRILLRFQMAMQNDEVRGGAWYLEALKVVAQQSRSELLETRVIELLSLGAPTLSGLKEELAKIGLDLDTQERLTDDEIIDMVLDLPGSEIRPLLDALSSLRSSSRTWQRAAAAAGMTTDGAFRVLSLPSTEFSSSSLAGTAPFADGSAGSGPELGAEVGAEVGAAVAAANDSTITELSARIAERFKAIWQAGTAIDKLEARYALQVLAFSQRSPALLALYEEVAPTPHDPAPGLAESYALIGVTSDVSDQDLEAIFEANCDDAGVSKLLELRRALHVIADERQSNELLAFLGYATSNDLIDLTAEYSPGPQLPVGLWNIGNTCYLNSLLQFYYSLSPVRDYVMTYKEPENENENTGMDSLSDCEIEEISLTPSNEKGSSAIDLTSEPHVSDAQAPGGDGGGDANMDSNSVLNSDQNGENNYEVVESKKKIGGRVVPNKEVRRSQIFVDRLGKLFKQMKGAATSHVTPSELVAYMALIPPQEDADEVIAAAGPEEESALRGRLIGALQRQQDVTECIENVLYQLEATMTPLSVDPEDGEQFDLVKGLFYGSTVQTLARVSDGANRRSKTERFSSLLLDVNNGPTPIYDSLDNYFADDILDLEDGPTLRTLRLKSVPEILQVQVQRVQFDKETFLPYKNINPLIFPEVVYLDRYLDAPEGSDLANRNADAKKWRAELAAIEKQLGAKPTVSGNAVTDRDKESSNDTDDVNFDAAKESGNIGSPNKINAGLIEQRDALETTLLWLTEGGTNKVSDETIQTVRDHHKKLSEQVSALESRRQELHHAITHQYDDLQVHGYRVHALFIHKGDVSYGHYWIYIRDSETGDFYKYNDEFVSRVSTDEVFDFRENNLATPYFLVFVKVN